MLITFAIVAGLLLPGVQGQAQVPGNLTYTAPSQWKARQPSSSMRVAEFELPAASAGGEGAELVIYYFGGGGGSVDANIQRWLGQFRQPDGRSSSDVAKRDSRTVHGLNVSMLEVSGTYIAEVRPGATEHFNKPGYRMRTAVIDTPRGPYFVKLVGPDATIAKWAQEFTAFVESVAFEPGVR